MVVKKLFILLFTISTFSQEIPIIDFSLGDYPINKKFKIKLKDDLSNIHFKLLNTGISANLNLFDKKQGNEFIGEIRGKILNSNIKFNFIYDLKKIEISDFFFRGKDLSFDSDGKLDLKPYFAISLKSKIKDNFILFNPSKKLIILLFL